MRGDMTISADFCILLFIGCGNPNADNYAPDADIFDESLCEFTAQGCMDVNACNYDSAAEQDNGLCTYPEAGFDCAGNCLSGTAVTFNW